MGFIQVHIWPQLHRVSFVNVSKGFQTESLRNNQHPPPQSYVSSTLCKVLNSFHTSILMLWFECVCVCASCSILTAIFSFLLTKKPLCNLGRIVCSGLCLRQNTLHYKPVWQCCASDELQLKWRSTLYPRLVLKQDDRNVHRIDWMPVSFAFQTKQP